LLSKILVDKGGTLEKVYFSRCYSALDYNPQRLSFAGSFRIMSKEDLHIGGDEEREES
jgi:hypothetical protein